MKKFYFLAGTVLNYYAGHIYLDVIDIHYFLNVTKLFILFRNCSQIYISNKNLKINQRFYLIIHMLSVYKYVTFDNNLLRH